MRARTTIISLCVAAMALGAGIAHGDDPRGSATEPAGAAAAATRTGHVEQVTPTLPPPTAPTTPAGPETSVPAGSGTASG